MKARIAEPRLRPEEIDNFMSAMHLIGLWPYPENIADYKRYAGALLEWVSDLAPGRLGNSTIGRADVAELRGLVVDARARENSERWQLDLQHWRSGPNSRRGAMGILANRRVNHAKRLASGYYRFNRDTELCRDECELEALYARVYRLRMALGLPVGPAHDS